MSLLPPNASPAERVLAELMTRVLSIPSRVQVLWSAEHCPPAHLPWLAWSLSVDDWHPDWPTERKRVVTAASYHVHRVKGTVGAVRTALAANGYNSRVVEWFEESPPATPATFAVEFDLPDDNRSDHYSDAERIALQTKNVRSHLRRLRAVARRHVDVRIGILTVTGCTTTIWPYQISDIDNHGQLYVAAASITSETTCIYPAS